MAFLSHPENISLVCCDLLFTKADAGEAAMEVEVVNEREMGNYAFVLGSGTCVISEQESFESPLFKGCLGTREKRRRADKGCDMGLHCMRHQEVLMNAWGQEVKIGCSATLFVTPRIPAENEYVRSIRLSCRLVIS